MLKNSSNSRVVDIESGATLKEFGRHLLAKIWQQLEVASDRYRHRHGTLDLTTWTWFQSEAYRTVLGVMAVNCRGEHDSRSPASLRWPSLAMFCGVGKGFQVEISGDDKRVVLIATDDMMRALGYERKTRSPFELPPFVKGKSSRKTDEEMIEKLTNQQAMEDANRDFFNIWTTQEQPPAAPVTAKTELTLMSEMHWPLRDDSKNELKPPTIKEIGAVRLMDDVPAIHSDQVWKDRPVPNTPPSWDVAVEAAGKVAEAIDETKPTVKDAVHEVITGSPPGIPS